jgi:hypothetical protein
MGLRSRSEAALLPCSVARWLKHLPRVANGLLPKGPMITDKRYADKGACTFEQQGFHDKYLLCKAFFQFGGMSALKLLGAGSVFSFLLGGSFLFLFLFLFLLGTLSEAGGQSRRP